MLFANEIVGVWEEAEIVVVLVVKSVVWTTYLKLHCYMNLWHTEYAQTAGGHVVHMK